MIQDIDALIDEAEELAIKERERYKDVYKLVDKYILDNNLVLGGEKGIKDLVGGSRSRTDFVYEIYTYNAFKHGNDLANILYKLPYIISLFTQVPNQRFIVNVDDRNMVILYNRDVEHIKGKKYNVLSHSLWLEQIYSDAFNLNATFDWSEYESMLRRKIGGKVKKDNPIILDFLDGKEHAIVSKNPLNVICSESLAKELAHFLEAEIIYRRVFSFGKLKKITIKKDKTLVNIFNISDYRLVPTIGKIAHPTVILYCLMIDYNIFKKLGINTNILNTVKKYKMSPIDWSEHIGQTDETREKIESKYPRYYFPNEYMIRFNKLRLIG